MAWRHKNRWFRRWLMAIVLWLVPVMIVAGREMRDAMAYNRADLQLALTTWTFTDAERNAGVHCAVAARRMRPEHWAAPPTCSPRMPHASGQRGTQSSAAAVGFQSPQRRTGCKQADSF